MPAEKLLKKKNNNLKKTFHQSPVSHQNCQDLLPITVLCLCYSPVALQCCSQLLLKPSTGASRSPHAPHQSVATCMSLVAARIRQVVLNSFSPGAGLLVTCV